jgi:hypothetical protein
MLQRRWLLVCIAIGAGLRLVWLDDMEYKGDQIYIFESCRSSLAGAALPMIGMPSGPGPRNPGMSLWWHIGFCELFQVDSPMQLAYFTPVLCVLALLLALWFTERVVAEPERPAWRWSLAFASVSTLEVSLARIIWSQTILPFFSVLYFWSYFRRDRAQGAFFWGLLGAMLGQIHMSGFFFAAAFVLAELWPLPHKRARWLPWLLGSLLGGLPLVPWLQYLAGQAGQSRAGTGLLKHLAELIKPVFWLYGFSGPWGLELSYRLGFHSWLQFLSEPVLAGFPTCLIGLCHLLLVGAGVYVYFRAYRSDATPLRQRLARFAAAFRSGTLDETARASATLIVGMGGLLTLTTLQLHRHYLIVAFPLWTVLFCRLALRHTPNAKGARLLAGMCALQLCVSVGFLWHVRTHGGAPGEEYGTPYRLQPPTAQRPAAPLMPVAPRGLAPLP